MAAFRFQITQEMVDRFAELTGDRSSLHVDAAFARRSPFRRCVVHGLLPVMYLSRCAFQVKDRNRVRLTELTARFLKPAFPGTTLELTWSEHTDPSIESTDPEAQTYTYSIARAPAGEPVTTGMFRIVPDDGDSTAEPNHRANDEEALSIIPVALQERSAVFDDLTKGEEAAFPVRIARSHVAALREILSLGTIEAGNDAESADPFGRTLLYAACSSTYVGMCMPGRFATYTELHSTWNRQTPGAMKASFAGKVSFLSPSTQTAVAQFTIRSDQSHERLGQGKVKVRVNDPQTEMPSMADVRQAVDMGLRDRVVLVTGASRGMGETMAKLFGAHHARVVVNYYRGDEDAHRVAREITDAGGQALPVQADVSDAAAVSRLIAEVTHTFGPVEILVNNAVGDYEARPFQNLQWEEVQYDLDVIVKGAFNCCQAVLPAMVERGFGRIVNLSTAAVEHPPINHSRYVVAKSALLGLTRSLAVEYAAHGICVNAVMPGFVETDLTANISKLIRDTTRQATPMKRHATPLDVARAVVYLASSWSGYTTGQQIAVTGGQPPFH